MTTSFVTPRHGQSFTLSPEATAILDDYQRFLQDIWDIPFTAPDAVLSDALLMLVERYYEFRQWRQQGSKPQRRAHPQLSRPSSHLTPSRVRIQRNPSRRQRSGRPP